MKEETITVEACYEHLIGLFKTPHECLFMLAQINRLQSLAFKTTSGFLELDKVDTEALSMSNLMQECILDILEGLIKK